MNSEREIIKRLFENCNFEDDVLNEKTYTVGDTQYWKRNGKTYKWTASGGRSECSEDEYMKAISGSSSNSVQNTEPTNDKARETDDSSKKSDVPTNPKRTRMSTDAKLDNFSKGLKDYEKEAFNSMMDGATPELKKIFANYSNKSQYRDGAKYEYASGAIDDSDTFNFYIPDASWTSMNKELYAAFGSGKPIYGGSAYKYTVPSTDSTGDFEIELGSDDRNKGCNLSIKKHY